MTNKETVNQTNSDPRSAAKSNGKLLRVSEVARMVDAHPNSIRRWADIGLLLSYRIGLRGDRRFKAEDVKVFLESFDRESNGRVAAAGRRNGYDA